MSEPLLDLKQVINAAAAILTRTVELPELHRAASLAIALLPFRIMMFFDFTNKDNAFDIVDLATVFAP